MLFLSGCAVGPGERFASLVARHRLETGTLAGTQFQHLYVRKPNQNSAKGWRVYLEGDGTPWVTRHRVARDPTARDPMALRLMLRDPGAALYLGRPCYHGVDALPPCEPTSWTSHRYSDAVVSSMAAALQRLAADGLVQGPVTLVGYSGGGVLAILLAARLPWVEHVVTIAANLDVDAWAQLHGYSPLVGSMNPARQPALSADVQQLHLAGGDDETVPPYLIARAVAYQPQAQRALALIPGFDHHCCWDSIWPTVLDALDGPEDTCAHLRRAIAGASCQGKRTQPR